MEHQGVERTLNMRAVLKETGLKADALRAWERRYGLPSPQRSAGGHRLYTDRDVAILHWLLARKAEGMSIGRAADWWKSLEAEGRDPLAVGDSDSVAGLGTGASIAELKQAWIEACMTFDESRAEKVMAQAFAIYPPEVVALGLLQAGVAHVGADWYRGRATVQQEHFASSLATRRLHSLWLASPPPTRTGRVAVACPPEELHSFGPLLLTFLLRRRGWETFFLGASVPVERLEVTLAAVRPHVLVLAAQQLRTAATLLEIAQVTQGQGVTVAYGGLIFNQLPALCERIPGYFVGEGIEESIPVIEQLLQAPGTLQPGRIVPAGAGCNQARLHYREHRAEVESVVWSALADADIPHPFLTMANESLAENILAALRLGDMQYMGEEIAWVEGLLTNLGLPREQLGRYLGAYRLAVRAVLDAPGEPIVAWFDHVLATGSEE